GWTARLLPFGDDDRRCRAPGVATRYASLAAGRRRGATCATTTCTTRSLVAAAPPGAAGRDAQRLANWLPLAGGRRSRQGRGSFSTVPPAVVIAASAAFVIGWARMVTARVISPRARTLISAPLWVR